ncbi:hypothetical protein [Phaeovulum sp. W22_SRMD_FR3]|uniref:hypothetical protein n=1 Tax=Phaeovulum sp. W22_SRMD_FR3 TaxID=3240274 RepID=UPI003F9D34B9
MTLLLAFLRTLLLTAVAVAFAVPASSFASAVAGGATQHAGMMTAATADDCADHTGGGPVTDPAHEAGCRAHCLGLAMAPVPPRVTPRVMRAARAVAPVSARAALSLSPEPEGQPPRP